MTQSEIDDGLALFAAGIGPAVRGSLFGIELPTSQYPMIEQIDHLNTSGIVAVDKHVYRILSSPSDVNASADLITYDAAGAIAYRRIDGLADPHGLIWDGANLVVPCSYTNEIVWLKPSGEQANRWRAPGEGDAWHINGVHVQAGRLFASAFGTFSTHRGWAKTLGDRTGMIFDVKTQASVVNGLTCPHDPMLIDGRWLVCDSFNRRIMLIDDDGSTIVRSVELDGWTRGVAVSASHIFVGVSGARHPAKGEQHARIVILDRANWMIRNEIKLPCEEISTLALVPRSFLPAFRRGFRTNDLRVAVQDRRDLLELAGQASAPMKLTPMEALERKNSRVRIWVDAPRQTTAGEYFDVTVTLFNRGRRTMMTAAPFPINIAIVFERQGDPIDAAQVRREALPAPLEPGAKRRFTLSVQSPQALGSYRVRFTLVQEWVHWFDGDRRLIERFRSSNRRYVNMRVTQA